MGNNNDFKYNSKGNSHCHFTSFFMRLLWWQGGRLIIGTYQILNQQMLAERRNRIRKEMRKEDLSRRFALQRKVMLDGPIALFREISKDIANCEQDQQLQYQLNHRLNQCLDAYDSQENTYLLIGNYLLTRPENHVYLQEKVLAAPKCLQNYVWSLYILASLHSERLKKGAQPREVHQLFLNILIMLNDLIPDMEKQIGIKEEHIKVKMMQLHFLCTIITIFETKFIPEESVRCIRYALNIIKGIQADECENEDLQYCVELFLVLKDNWELLESHQLEVLCAMAFSKIIGICLKNLPQVRQQCIDLLHFFAHYNNSTGFMTYIFTSELLTEIIFFLGELPSIKVSIFSLLQEILSIINVQNLSLILSLQIHMILTSGMEQAMQECNNKLLEICLQGLLSLLTKLRYLQEEKLFQHVKSDIESLNFHLMIEGLFNNDQNQAITHLVNIIVDDFYSEEQEPL